MPLVPLNECGVPKFVCTTLRPSLPAFPELYTLEGCAKFVSECLTFEHLEDPLHPPKHMPSPMSVLSWQAADPFDAAIVLCSLLLGAGYNAYVVMGYAPLAVTLNDQSNTECPFWQDADAVPGTASSVAQTAANKRGSMFNGATAAAGVADNPTNAAASGATSSGAAKANGSQAAGASADEPGKRKKYQVRPKPQLFSKYQHEHGNYDADAGPSDDVVSTSQVSRAYNSHESAVGDRPLLVSTEAQGSMQQLCDANGMHVLDSTASHQHIVAYGILVDVSYMEWGS